jgi:hypothetical protein
MARQLPPATRKKSGLIQVAVGSLMLLGSFLVWGDSSLWIRIPLWVLGPLLALSGIGLLLPEPAAPAIPASELLKRKPALRPVPAPTAPPGSTGPREVTSAASNPGCLTLSMDALQHFHPYLVSGNAEAHPEDAKFFAGMERDWALWRIKELLARGDSRPAIVSGVSDKILIIGAYSDDFDACVFLVAVGEDARRLTRKHGLQRGSRLIAVNNFMDPKPDGSIQADIHIGENAESPIWSGVWPVIGDFVSDDHDQLAALKANISDEQWQRASDLAFASYEGGLRIRGVAPFRSMFEGKTI